MEGKWRKRSVVASSATLCAALAVALVPGQPRPRPEPAAHVAPAPSHLTVHSTFPDDGTRLQASGLNAPVVGAAAVPGGDGWWEVAADGGIFSFGSAAFHGSTGAIRLNQPIVGMAATPDGQGYWLVAADGGIFSFGSAAFHGSTGAIRLNQPIVGMAATPDGQGYWLVAADGGVFTFGDASFQGSAGGVGLSTSAIVASPTGHGYWIVGTSGQVLPYGDAPAVGSATGVSAPVAGAGLNAKGPGLRVVARDGSSVGLPGGTAAAATPPLGTPAPPPGPSIRMAGSPTSYTWLVTNADGSPVRWNPCAPIHYVTNLAEAPAGAGPLVSQAFAQISAITGLTFVDDGPTGETPSNERAAYQPSTYGGRWAPVLVAWSRASQTDILPGGNIIGEGGSSWVEAAGGPKIFITGEAVIDADNTGSLPASFGAGSTLGELLLHELGHVVGLGHTADTNQIMYPTLLPVPSATYGVGDADGLRLLGQQAGCLSVPSPA